jgi:UDP-N-acetylmuramoyl-tripeptide--D-alanyl-D-alanine ligase
VLGIAPMPVETWGEDRNKEMWRADYQKKLKQYVSHALSLVGAEKPSIEAWRLARQRLLRTIYRRMFLWPAALYRRVGLHCVVFIGVTGSCGKTTTKELIAAVLASRFKGRKNPGNRNLPLSLAKTIMRVRPWDDFCVLEIAAAIGGQRIALERPLSLVRPQIGVVTNIGTDHLSAFGTVEAIVGEKGKLIAALPPDGTAVLNADDPRVFGMRAQCVGKVLTYGLAPEAMMRAEHISSCWPERLSFTVRYAGQAQEVQTQLCGAHWVPCVLAALAVGVALKVPLATAARAVEKVPPYSGRMEPIQRPDGVTFVDDSIKAPLWSIPASLQFMREARAPRKVVVIGTISDFRGTSNSVKARIYADVARQALEVAEYAVFVGPHARKALRARRQSGDAALQAFYVVEAACDYLGNLLQPGDLVLLKDSNCERLGKIIAACPPGHTWPPSAASAGSTAPAAAERPAIAVVGLGNPDEQFHDTPHNVGQRVLDRLAQALGGEWIQEEQALVAHVEQGDTTVYLIKPLTCMNATGPVLVPLANRLGVRPATCVLVHDDADLPLGAVRARMKGSAGGHRGVRSILEAFHTDAIRRVKLGVGRPTQQAQLAAYVLAAFAPAERPVIDRACAEAADRTLRLLGEIKRSGAM